ncbi:HlyIII-domain-containing protein [Zopfia rhizophila CBS 207.26]|uniref:HlyIII-domain-containing protein n=1 Tax=Zopfia rhizophila CBS 207.26 TaxID=1314779 RepID=A0A6A6DLE5_9PEZI|nr:HlyIII-domain-containing protein [Zopfia rhizophila CBS 207.26]
MLLRWKRLPKWQKQNKYIRSGYRKPSYSYYGSTRDIARWHNETVNIWSHLFAAIIFSWFLIRFLAQSGSLTLDVVAVATFFLGAIVCFTLSFVHHLLSNHSRRVMILTQRLDRFGTVTFIWSTVVSFLYFAFYLRPPITGILHWRYNGSRSVHDAVFLSANIQGSRKPSHAHIDFLRPRALGNPTDDCLSPVLLASYRNLIILNAIGGFFYCMRIPERFCQDAFDIVGSSHQVMHIMVVAGALLYRAGLLSAGRAWQGEGATGLPCPTG